MIHKLTTSFCVLCLMIWVAGCNNSNETVVKPNRNTSSGNAARADNTSRQGQASNNRSGAERTSRGSRSGASSSNSDAGNTGSGGSKNNQKTTLDKMAERDDLPEEVKKRFEKAKRKK